MSQLERKNLACPDTVIGFDGGRRAVMRVGGAIVGQWVLDPGAGWSSDAGWVAGAAGRARPQLSYVAHGHLVVEYADGRRLELGPGDVAAIPGWHRAWTVRDDVCVLFELPPPWGHDGGE
jgi:hypothetical protein